MNRREYCCQIGQLRQERRLAGLSDLLDELEVSLTIFTRDLEHPQPLSRTRRFGPGVVRLSRRQASKSDLKLGLPGMWFIESEADALVAMQHLRSSLDR